MRPAGDRPDPPSATPRCHPSARTSAYTRSPDPVVIAKAQELDCVLLSLNGDFADIVTYPPSFYGGIIALQLHNHPEIIPQLLGNLGEYLDRQSDRQFFRGKLFIVEVHRIRIRL